MITGEREARIEAWRQALHWDAPLLKHYRQGDGTVVFDLAIFGGRRGAPACAGN